ncbi:hypothetical protein EYF80_010018 [Liparis tanakae]|uniref:Uncharacterized protein n=1 Tax=Liparis tanakae TaxID=230148 RepID=A0A4Z2IQI6_9TELE|nr:hypothetical protein EYF80_010018 [Liparis tanakae]
MVMSAGTEHGIRVIRRWGSSIIDGWKQHLITEWALRLISSTVFFLESWSDPAPAMRPVASSVAPPAAELSTSRRTPGKTDLSKIQYYMEAVS